MATTNAALPPMDKLSMIGIWVETVLYGVNCVMYALCMLVLLRGGKVPTLRWVLVVTSTMLIVLATVHVGVSLQQLLKAFIYAPPDIPDYSTTYWVSGNESTLSLLKYNTYETLVFTQDFIIIWRLYVVFLYDWRVILFPMILEAASIGTAYSATAITGNPDVGLYDSVVPGLIISAGVLDATLNVSVTMAIAVRLWWMGRTTASLMSTPTNRYVLSIYIVVESGAIFAGVNIVSLVLYASRNPASSVGFTVASQLATLTPLLIVVQAGLTGHHRFSSGNYPKAVLTAQDKIVFQVGIPQDLQQDSSDTALTRLPSSVHGAHLW
ncbi:hypothetical protein HD554DRAFT_863158 [Boletus coccyginus]|nr:hypothetical protein HD554DRAFT_863158 [Boletus coccyginus]